MQTTIKQLRRMIDNGLITAQEVKGFTVKIGFLSLIVTGYELTPGDYLPNIWLLTRNGKNYKFTPYNGLEQI